MPRGQSPYQGQYTVPIHDYGAIERGGAAWGEAFKDVGQSIGTAIEKYQVDRQKDATLDASLQGEVDALRENEEQFKKIESDKEGGKLLKDFLDGKLTLKGKQQFKGYLTGYTGGLEQQTRAQLNAANANIADMNEGITKIGLEVKQDVKNYNDTGWENVNNLLDGIGAKHRAQGAAWINNQVTQNNLSIKEATEKWDDTQSDKVNKLLLASLSFRDKSLLAQADQFGTGTAKPMSAAEQTQLVANTENIQYQYEVASKERDARPPAQVVAETEAKRDRAETLEALKLRKEEAELITVEAEAADATDRITRIKEEADNKSKLAEMDMRAKKRARKLLKKHPDGVVFQQTLPDGTIVDMFYSGQAFHVVDTGKVTAKQRFDASKSMMGDKVATYYFEVRDNDTGIIDEQADLNPDLEQIYLRMMGVDLSRGWPKGVKDEDGNPIELYKQRAPWLPAKLPTTPTTPAPKKGGGVGPLKLQPRQPQP